jgi:hypothetical protein
MAAVQRTSLDFAFLPRRNIRHHIELYAAKSEAHGSHRRHARSQRQVLRISILRGNSRLVRLQRPQKVQQILLIF